MSVSFGRRLHRFQQSSSQQPDAQEYIKIWPTIQMVGTIYCMATKLEVLDRAITVLRRGDALTHDAVAREAGLTKPGVVHYFSTKEELAVAVVDRIIDRWEADLHAHADDGADPVDMLYAYVDYAITGHFDQSDLALLADVRLRDRLCELWTQRLDPWFGSDIEAGPVARASMRAARLLADGAWFNAALGIPTIRDDEREAVRVIARELISKGVSS